jgi:hypothetical protein
MVHALCPPLPAVPLDRGRGREGPESRSETLAAL